MQQLMASLVFGMSVDDAAYRAGMASARREAQRTEQDFERAGGGMADAIQRSALAVNRAALSMVDSFNSAVSGVKRAGLALTVGLTVPLGLAGKSAKDTASDFQGAMNKVKAAMLTASPKEIEQLRDAALELGPAMGRSAIEAAGAIEALAKNGMDASRILGGGLEAALKLAAVGQTDLGAAADATTDILQQFHLSTSQLPDVVNKVSGALDASKLTFDGYKDAIGQVGGIAGGLGYSFEDMNAALAAVVPLMTGGSDAGTSFKTFLLSLVPTSKDAERKMKELGISFFDAAGNIKPLNEVAEVLNTRLANLSQQDRQDVLTTIFGTDGMRVAVALMQAGAKGVADVKSQIDAASADQKLAVLLEGEAQATQRLAAAWEKLKIGIGEAGLIQVLTAIKDVTASVVETIASAPPALFYMVNVMGLVAAAAGPLVLGLGAVIGIAAPMIITMGRIGLAGRILVGVLGAIVNPLGMVGRGLLYIAARAGAATLVARFGVAVSAALGPIGLLATGLSILYPLLKGLGEISEATARAQDDAARAHGEAEDAISRLSTSTGKAREAAMAHARALRVQHLQQLQTARSALALAQAEYLQRRKDAESGTLGGQFRSSAAYQWWTGKKDVVGAGKDFIGQGRAVLDRMSDIQALDAAIAGAGKAGGGPTGLVGEDEGDKKKGRAKAGRDAAEDQARFDDEFGRLKVDTLRAQADLSEGIRSRYAAEMASIDEERASYARQIAGDEALTAAKRGTLLAAKDEELAVRRTIAERDLSIGLAQEEYDLFAARNDADQEIVRASLDLADSAAAQRAGQLRLLDLQRQREAAEIELVLATKATASAEYQNALDRRRTLDERYGRQEVGVRRQTEGPVAGYLRSLNLSADGMREAVEAGGVDALRGLNSELVAAGFNVRKLGNAFANMGNRIIATLAEIAIQQKIIRPMAERLLGNGEGRGGGGWLSSLLKIGTSVAAAQGGGGGMTGGDGSLGNIAPGSQSGAGLIPIDFGGYRAAGGRIEPNKWYMTGEKGPEPFFAGRPGTMLSNEALGSVGRRAPVVIQIVGDEGAAFVPRVAGISGEVSVETTSRGLRGAARRQGRASRFKLD